MPDEDRSTLDGFVAGLPARFAEVAACGVPDTLVHGDYHPGNVRGTPGRLVMLDWGDTGVGQPLLDLPAFLEAVPPSSRGADPRPLARPRGAPRSPAATPGAPRSSWRRSRPPARR